MDQVTKVRSDLKRKQWKALITECRNSGMTVKDWCNTNGIVEQTSYQGHRCIPRWSKCLNAGMCQTPSCSRHLMGCQALYEYGSSL